MMLSESCPPSLSQPFTSRQCSSVLLGPTLLLFMCSWLTSAASTAAEELEWVSFPAGTRFQLSADNNSVRIPVLASEKVDFAKVKLAVESIVFDSRADQAFLQTFVPKLTPGTAGSLPTMVIDVAGDRSTEPGSYVLTCLLTSGDSMTYPPKSVKIELIRPAAQLAPPSLVKVDYEVPGFERKGLLNLRETTKKSALTHLELRPISATNERNEPVDVRFQLKSPLNLGRGQAAEVDYEVIGTVPLGITNGQLEITADELPAPVPVNFQISYRRHWGFLIFAIGLGLAFGFGTRVVLQGIAATEEARLQAYPVARKAESLLREIEDPIFQRNLRAQLTALKSSLPSGTAANLQSLQQALATAIATETRDHNLRFAEATDQLASFKSVVDGQWFVDAALRQPLEQSRTRVQRLLKRLQATHNPEEAKQAGDELRHQLAAECNQHATTWRERARNELARFATIVGELPVEMKSSSQEQVKRLTAACNDIPVGTATPDAKAILEKLHIARRLLDDSVKDVVRQVEAIAESIQRELLDSRPRNADEVEKLATVAAEVQQQLAGENVPPEDILKHANHGLPVLLKAVDDALLAQIDAPSEEHEALQKLLRSGDYRTATQQVIDLLTAPVRPAEGTRHTVPAARAALRRVVFSAPVSSSLPPAPPIPPAVEFVPLPLIRIDTPPLDPEVVARNRLSWANYVRTGIFAVMITGVGYFLFGKTFIGTGQDFAAAFFWGFFTDIGMDQLQDLSAKFRTPPKAS